MPITKRSKTDGLQLFWWRQPRAVGRPRRTTVKLSEKLSKKMSKRRRFVIVAVSLTAIMFVIQRLSVEMRYLAIGGLGLMSYLLSLWALRRDLVGVAWLTDLILPTIYPVAVALFYFLLPQQPVTRLVVLGVFAITMYALMLTANIFAVASNRTIQLLRAARTVGFLLSVVTVALLFHVLFSLNLAFWIVTGGAVVISFPIFIEGLWGYTLSNKLGRGELLYSLIGTILVMEATLALSFWLVEPLMASVMLSMMVYVLLGLFQHEIDKRLFSKTIQEYVGFAIIVFVIVSLTVLVRWAA